MFVNIHSLLPSLSPSISVPLPPSLFHPPLSPLSFSPYLLPLSLAPSLPSPSLSLPPSPSLSLSLPFSRITVSTNQTYGALLSQYYFMHTIDFHLTEYHPHRRSKLSGFPVLVMERLSLLNRRA